MTIEWEYCPFCGEKIEHTEESIWVLGGEGEYIYSLDCCKYCVETVRTVDKKAGGGVSNYEEKPHKQTEVFRMSNMRSHTSQSATAR